MLEICLFAYDLEYFIGLDLACNPYATPSAAILRQREEGNLILQLNLLMISILQICIRLEFTDMSQELLDLY